MNTTQNENTDKKKKLSVWEIIIRIIIAVAGVLTGVGVQAMTT